MFGRRSQRDFEEEIRSHLALEIDRLRGEGMSAGEAERAARRAFGNEVIAGDRFREGQRFASVENALRDFSHAWRGLLRTPGFMAAAVITLALAMGATTGMFNVVRTVMLEPLPYAHRDRLVFLGGTAPGTDLPDRFDLGTDFYFHYRDRSQLLEDLFIFIGGTSTFRTDERVERIRMAWPTNDMYSTLGMRPQLGRLPVPEDGEDVVLISDQMWSSWFGRDPSVIGRTYYVSNGMKQVIGIMPPEFRFPDDNTMLWVAGEARLEQVSPGDIGNPIVARMKPGVTREQLAAELTALSKEMPGRFGGSPAYSRMLEQHRALIDPLLDRMVGSTARTSLLVLLGAALFVLLIACANVANLFLVRAESRRRDMTLRRALGASRTQLMRLQLGESLAVALPAGVLAVMLSAATLPLFVRAASEGVPRLDQAGIDLVTVATAFALVLFVTFACGVVPALRASAPDFARLREGGRGSTVRRQWGRDMLVVTQTALALVLLIGSALLLYSFRSLRNVDPGYDIAGIYTFQFAPQQPHLNDGPSLGHLHLTMMDRLRALPGVTDVGVVNNIPLDEATSSVRVLTDRGGEGGALMNLNFTGGDYFRAMGISLLQGRTFSSDEAVTPNNSVIISQSAAAKLWPEQNALGRQLRPRFGGQDTLSFTVVGVVDDVKQNEWREAGEAVLYLPLTGPSPQAWGMGSPAYVVKSARAGALTNDVRALVRELAPEAPVYREYTMEFLAQRSMVQLTFTTLTLGVVSALALMLGLLGLYGVLSYVVAQRTREIGVRMALGATAGAVQRQVVTQGARVVLIGVVIGLGAALLSTRFLGTLLYGVDALDPLVFAAVSLLMLSMGGLASYIPARRASGVPPIEALRND
jgi:putative ABC transport system permease protein